MSLAWAVLLRRGARTRRARSDAGASRRVALEHLEERQLLSTGIPLAGDVWTQIGPSPITGGQTSGNGAVSGRVVGVAGDPIDPNLIYVAAAGGGVWKSDTAGQTWTPLTDSQSTLKMGAIAVAPSNGKVIYAGTGEANNAGDSSYGRGVLVSRDGGDTWALTGSNVFDRMTISTLAVDPTNPNIAYAAVCNFGVNGVSGTTGIYKTTNGGQTWSNTTSTISTQAQYTGITVDPKNPLNLLAAVGTFYGDAANGVYKSTDGGSTWKAAGDFPIGSSNGRIALAEGASDPSVAYAAISASGTYGLLGVYKTTDGGTTWKQTAAPPDYLSSQGWYDNTIAVSPTDANVVFVGGILNYSNNTNSILESRDGGASWFDLTTDVNGNGPHTDHHALGFDASGRLLNGNDGGIWRLDNPGQNTLRWTDLNSGLVITTFTGIALDPTNADIIYGGSQDNGTERYDGNSTGAWQHIQDGDGGYVRVDPSKPTTVYHTFYGRSLERSDDSGKNWTDISSGLTGNGNFYSFYILDPNTPSRILYGTDRINVSNDRGLTWSTISSPNSAGWDTTDPINFLAVAQGNSQVIYASTGSHLYATKDGGTSWTRIDVAGATGGYSSLFIDPNDAQTVYATRASFTGSASGHVFKSTNGGTSWTDISGNLPDIPATVILADTRPGHQALFLGTDTGVFFSSDGGQTWAPYRSGMPNVQISTLELNPALNVLAAGTYGRGVFEIIPDGLLVQKALLDPIPEYSLLDGIVLATVSDPGAAHPASDYQAIINWGDGSPTSVGVLTPNASGGFDISSVGKSYAEGGKYKVTISVTNLVTGLSGTGGFTLPILDAPLIPAPAADVSGVEGNATDLNFGSFADTDKYATDPSDYTVSITWGDGAVGTGLVTPEAGQFNRFDVLASRVFARFGDYTYTVVVTDAGGATATFSGVAHIEDAPLLAGQTPSTFAPIEGQFFSGAVASVQDTNPDGVLSDLSATISWGDGRTTPGLILNDPLNAGSFLISGSNKYARFGDYDYTITVNSLGGQKLVINGTVGVADAGLSAVGTGFGQVEGKDFSGSIATVRDSNPGGLLSDLSATVNWGDGSPSEAATLVAGGGGAFLVQGTHKFNEEGNFDIRVDVYSAGGQTTYAITKASISNASLVASSTGLGPLASVEGTSFSGVVATFVDGNPTEPIPDFTVQINWGDGTPATTGTITQLPSGVFQISGDHTYNEFGSYTIATSLHDDAGAKTSASLPITVSDAPISASGYELLVGHEGVAFTDSVAIFTDQNPASRLGDFTATIDWGDKTSSVGMITRVGDGSYLVSGNHVYATNTDGYPVKVTVVSAGGQTQTVGTTVSVLNGVITPQPVAITPPPSEGVRFNAVVASFTDTNPLAVASEYRATIDWGDGATSPGVVLATDGQFVVRGSHVFLSGDHRIKVTIVDDDQADIPPVSGSLTVPSAPIDATVKSGLKAVEGTPFTDTVATFTSGNPLAVASDFQAYISWGDGTVSDPNTVIRASGIPGQFAVSGNHLFSYGPGLPLAVDVVSTRGGASTQVTGQIDATDAPLKLSASPSLVGVGQPGDRVLATLTDPDTTSLPSEFLVGIDWGDGTHTAGHLVAGAPGQFSVLGDHAYARSGSFTATVTVKAVAGTGDQTASTVEPVTVSPASLSSNFSPFSVLATVPFSGQVATFGSVNSSAGPGDFAATIYWGDGTQSDGAVVRLRSGTLAVTGDHTYASSGDRTVGVSITSNEGVRTSATGTVQVAVHTTPLSGSASIPGASPGAVGETNNPQPTFSGSGEPGSHLVLTARRNDFSAPQVIGQATIGADGAWTLRSSTLLDGTYTVTATSTDASGHATSDPVTFPSFVVDTVAPRITDVRFDPKAGKVYITVQDDRSGLDDASLANAANYDLSLGAATVPIRGISVSPGPGSTPRVVTLDVAPPGKKKGAARAGRYTLSINGKAIHDESGNALSEQFFLPTPTSTKNGYIASLVTNGNTLAGPQLVTSNGIGKRKVSAFRRKHH